MNFISVVAIMAFVAVYLQCSTAQDFKCQQGVPYIENDCNGCFCTPTGILGCTRKTCPQVDTPKLFNCQVGTSYDKGCNKCWCVKDQGTVCTNKEC